MHVWYIRRRGEVKGPYPAGLITRYVLLGRIREDDEISPDGQVWTLLREHQELIPEVMKAAAAYPAAQQRLEAARRWADERGDERRGTREESEGAAGVEQRIGARDRRTHDAAPVAHHRASPGAREIERETSSHQRTALAIIFGVVGMAVAALAYFYRPPPPDKAVDCNSVPAPRIDWSNCALDGARLGGADLTNARLYSARMTGADLRAVRLAGGDLSYATLNLALLDGADLRGATLVGASLRRARLTHAHLEKADLSYADLAGAELTDASFAEAKLGNAIWFDGRVCAPESVGTCARRP